MASKHILVAEDEEYMCRSLSLILRRAGHTVTAVLDGKRALEKILELRTTPDPVDLLITDVQMPGLTGLELIAWLDQLHVPMPVLIITGYARRDDAAAHRGERCVEYIEKPFDMEHLMAMVAGALETTPGQPCGT